jgi:hypothetical protein
MRIWLEKHCQGIVSSECCCSKRAFVMHTLKTQNRLFSIYVVREHFQVSSLSNRKPRETEPWQGATIEQFEPPCWTGAMYGIAGAYSKVIPGLWIFPGGSQECVEILKSSSFWVLYRSPRKYYSILLHSIHPYICSVFCHPLAKYSVTRVTHIFSHHRAELSFVLVLSILSS